MKTLSDITAHMELDRRARAQLDIVRCKMLGNRIDPDLQAKAAAQTATTVERLSRARAIEHAAGSNAVRSNEVHLASR